MSVEPEDDDEESLLSETPDNRKDLAVKYKLTMNATKRRLRKLCALQNISKKKKTSCGFNGNPCNTPDNYFKISSKPPRETDRDKERARDKERDRERGRASENKRDIERWRERERDKDRLRDRDRERERDREGEGEGTRGEQREFNRIGNKYREREKHRDRDREGGREREGGRDREGGRERRRGSSGDNSRGKEGGREGGRERNLQDCLDGKVLGPQRTRSLSRTDGERQTTDFRHNKKTKSTYWRSSWVDKENIFKSESSLIWEASYTAARLRQQKKKNETCCTIS